MNTTSQSGRRSSWIMLGLFLVWIIAYFGARELLSSPSLENWLRIAIAIVPIPLYAGLMVMFIRNLRQLDEMELRIQLESLAIAFPLTLLMLLTLGLFERAVGLKFEDWSYAHVAMYPFIFYFFGIAIAAKGYR